MVQKIKFFTTIQNMEHLVDRPVPAKQAVPKWYTRLDKFITDGNKLKIHDNGAANTGLKTCMSFLDTLTSGYIVQLHCDIYVERDEGKFNMSWTSVEKPISPRGPEMAAQLPNLPGFDSFSQAWELKWGFVVPKGYSVLVTQPLNRFDLPTFCTSGIIDADVMISGGGIPFALRSDFEGIIPAGTPIAQLFPYKRDDWKSEVMEAGPDSLAAANRARNKVYGWYRETLWKKKNFD